MKNIFLIIIILGVSVPGIAMKVPGDGSTPEYIEFQILPEELLVQIMENNTTIRAAREQYQLSLAAANTGNAPPDPEIEMGILSGKPSSLGNRLDFGVIQRIEFPSAYIHLSRIRKIRYNEAELRYILVRQEILMNARKLWVERTCLQKELELVGQRLEEEEELHSQYVIKFETGETDRLALNQSKLLLTSLRNEYEKLNSSIKSTDIALAQICGGEKVILPAFGVPDPVKFNPDSLEEDYRNSTEIQLLEQNQELKRQEEKLAVSRYLPELMVGYYSETVIDQQFKGLQLGFNIPLWGNSGNIKQAKAGFLVAEAETNDFLSKQEAVTKRKIEAWKSLSDRLDSYKETMADINDVTLLKESLTHGEISFSEYIYASEFYFRNVQSLYQLEKELLILETELLKIYF